MAISVSRFLHGASFFDLQLRKLKNIVVDKRCNKVLAGRQMNLDKAVMGFAGVMVLVSVALAFFHSQYWLLFTVFVGLNLLQASFTGFCPAAIVFGKLGIKSGSVFQVAPASQSPGA